MKTIKQLQTEREYRPVGVAVLYQDGLFLVTQSAKHLAAWGFPQGGFDEGETIEENLQRELHEELGILPAHIQITRPNFYHQALDAESARKDKRGYTKGKAYFCTLADYVGESNFILQPEEVADAQWMTPQQAVSHFYMGREPKARLNEHVLNLAMGALNATTTS